MMNTFTLEIVARETHSPARAAISLDVPAAGGRLTVLAGHQPMICSIVAGTARILLADGSRERWNVTEGALRVGRGETVLVVRTAEKAGD